ncbi:sulfotransferase domain-containing protein [Sulfuritalea sp.]|jgi:hypothetical protein|uniref:sulfotransferase domain-containing protein n=1 Tax=Sulfuritalea sp. TaxID=2480090 RepID=UPI001AC17FDE|nr:sulfotransferase domain-containing protein [Sulfuritalea sp.]MBN8474940.1 sulfotransferase domain-containing protein [Sulfuritalea sp.]
MTWVFCAGMIRSGSTLQFQLASNIIERAGLGHRMKYVPESEFEPLVGSNTNDTEMRVFKAHICTPVMADLCHSEKAMVVYCYRDIRDVAVSALRKFDMTFDALIDAQWLDQAIYDFRAWTGTPNVLISCYEDTIGDLRNEVFRISSFLGANLGNEEINLLAKQFTIPAQKQRIEAVRRRESGTIATKDSVYDEYELLHHNHIHKGEVGGWRVELSSDQQRFLTERYKPWLLSLHYSCD